MKIVYDNIIYSLQRAGGISVVWSKLISHILNLCDDVSFIEYEGAEDNISRFTLNIPKNIIDKKSGEMITVKRYLDPVIKNKESFIFHSSYFRICNNPYAINITTVHDFTYEYYAKNPIKRWLHCRQKYHAIKKSDMIVCISENTKRDLLKFLPDIPEERIKVIYNGVDDTFHVTKDHTTGNYVLYVGNRDPYKNFDKIIEPISELGLNLKIVGAPLNKNELKLLKKFNCKYKHLGYTNCETLNELYNHAICLLYPSEYEGFGLPILEAQKAGCPVIAYNGSSVKEIIGDSKLLLQSTNKEDIVNKILLLKNDSLRKEIISNGLHNSKKFSWNKMTNDYYSLYSQIFCHEYNKQF